MVGIDVDFVDFSFVRAAQPVFWMNGNKIEVESVSRLAGKGSLRAISSGSLSCDLPKPVIIILASKLLKPEG